MFCFFAVWAGGRVDFLLFGRETFFFFVWAEGVFFFAVWAGAWFFFAVWAGGVFIFFAVWARGLCLFCWLGGGREFTHLPVCLVRLHVFKRPKNKKDQTAKQKHWFRVGGGGARLTADQRRNHQAKPVYVKLLNAEL